MNNNFDHTICSLTSVERYLLNKMSTDEETLFQEHLHTCSACGAYLSSIRNLAGIKNEKSLSPTAMRLKKRQVPLIFLSTNLLRVMAAACLLPVCVILLYKYLREPGIPSDTQIIYQNKASVAYVDTSCFSRSLSDKQANRLDTLFLLSPTQPVSIVYPAEEEIVFRWHGESSFQLKLEANGKIVAYIDSVGTNCTIDSSLAACHEYLDWTLAIEGKKRKGRLYIQTK